MFCGPYEVFSGKFQSAHFVLLRNVRLRRSYSTVKIHLIKFSLNSEPWYFNANVSIRFWERLLLQIDSFFDSLLIHQPSFVVVFLGLPSSFLASKVFLKYYE